VIKISFDRVGNFERLVFFAGKWKCGKGDLLRVHVDITCIN
jgi:hypothetical protein